MYRGKRHILLAMFLIVCLVLTMSSFGYAEESADVQGNETLELSNNGSGSLVSDGSNQYEMPVSATDNKDEASDSPEIAVTEVTQGEEYDVRLYHVLESDYDFIVFKVWSDEENEEDVVLYPAEWQDGEELKEDDFPHFLSHILISNHKPADLYQIAAFGVNQSEDTEIESVEDITIEMLFDEEISTEIEKTSLEIQQTEDEEIVQPDEKNEPINDKLQPEEEEIIEEKMVEKEAVIDNTAVESPRLMLKAAASPTSLRGIDVSKHNGNIDWAKVKAAGIKYAIIRCGFGDDIASQDDSKWAYNVSECERLGIPYGVYIYSYATSLAHVQSEASHCIRLLKGHKPAYPVFLDLEDDCMKNFSNATLASMTQAWATKIMSAGYTPGVYSSKNWWTNKLTSSVFNNYCKWVAQWNSSCTYTGTYHAWQYSSTGSVNGISGNVDMNYWYGYSNYTIDYGSVSGSGPEFGLYEVVSTLDENYALDIDNASQANKANVQLYKRNGTGAQKFWIIPIGYDNQYYIMNRTSGKYLDVDNNETADRTNIWQYNGNGTSAQRFRIISDGKGAYEIQGVGSDKYIDVDQANAVNRTNIQIYKSNHTAAQKWKFVLTKDLMPDSSSYEIVSSINPNFTMDIELASKEAKANLQLYKRNKTLAQRFTFVPVGHDDLYFIVNKGSGKTLDVVNNGKESRTNVWQYNHNGTEAQIFKLLPLDGGIFEICGLGSGKYLDVDNAKDANGTNIQIYNGNGTAAQKWYFMRLD